ncbi:MAG: FkbM family methyltransferase [Coleofasciculaceae cyanobacterium]
MSKTVIKSLLKKIINFYSSLGYPLLPVTKFIREPMRWYYHRSPLLKHDSRFSWKPRLLSLLHSLFVVDHPHDFNVYHNQIKFRSFGSLMSVQGYYVGEIEYHLVQYLVKQICPTFVMVDVGAHHGLYTLIVAHELKSRGWEGIIHSFEPDYRNFNLLKYNVHQNKLEKYVVLHQEAVTNVESEQKLLTFMHENSANTLESSSYISNHYINNQNDNDKASTQSVKTIKLDSLLYELPKVNLIKIDIQGSEYLALIGAEKIIIRDRPIILVEAVSEWETTIKIREFLVAQNYSIYGVDANGMLCEQDSTAVFVSWDWIGLPIRAF